MDSLLAGAEWWFLGRLEYEGELLTIDVTEGIVADDPQNVTIEGAGSVSGASAIEITPQSRHVRIEFGGVLAYQVTDESYAAAEYGAAQGGVLARHDKSAYLQHVLEQSLIPDLVDDTVHHYSLTLADDIIDIITTNPPKLMSFTPNSNP